jgi:2-hydroxychromene-2-carboxylate isomerase
MSAPIDFWFSIGSTYTYLSVMRIGDIERQNGIAFRWRPFDIRAIMTEMNTVPVTYKPAKARYMWRDIVRRAKMYGLRWSTIPPDPIKHLAFANGVALIAAREGWCPQFVRTAYRRWFVDGHDPSSEQELTGALGEIGQNPAAILARAASDAAKADLNAETEAARALGIFGSPTFVTGSEIFWGDDRLDDAIRWQLQAKH